jgi:hypothetical protein
MSGSAVAIALFKQHHQEYQQQQQQRHHQLTSRLYNSLNHSNARGDGGNGTAVGSGNHNNNNNNTNDGATGSSNISFNSNPLNNNLLSKHSTPTNNHNNVSVGSVANLAATAQSAAGTNSSSGNSGSYLLPCPLCETPLEPRVFRHHLDRHYPRDSPICPVIQCGRRFAHPNSVRNHMRLKHTMQWAKMKAMRSSGGPYVGMKGDGTERFMIP